MVEMAHELAELLRERKEDEAKRLLTRVPALTHFKDDSGRSTVHFAAVGGSLPLLQFSIIDNPELANEEDELGWTPLIIASSAGRVEVVRFLLTLPHVNVNQTNSNKQSALHYACSKNHIEIVKLLIEADPGCVNITDKFWSDRFTSCGQSGQ
uniref:ANK_REP_REGION domain-containing protein n=2 Tax=Caenorhabditis japonica TaxID=281687 RepID=A0A8R1ESR6_CAEJA